MTNDRLVLARWEADRHAAVLQDALAEWACVAPSMIEAVETDRHLRQLTDAIDAAAALVAAYRAWSGRLPASGGG